MRNERAANYLCHEECTIETGDHQDHTFSGIMFGIQSKSALPVDFIEVTGVSVRGRLGPMTVWTTPGDYRGKHENKEEWDLVFNEERTQSINKLVPLHFDKPLRIAPNERWSIYVHSQLYGDEGVVYDNQRSRITHEDEHMQILPAIAHLSGTPFSPHAWGWGTWRDRRAFVGKVEYSIRYLLWAPKVHSRYKGTWVQR